MKDGGIPMAPVIPMLNPGLPCDQRPTLLQDRKAFLEEARIGEQRHSLTRRADLDYAIICILQRDFGFRARDQGLEILRQAARIVSMKIERRRKSFPQSQPREIVPHSASVRPGRAFLAGG